MPTFGLLALLCLLLTKGHTELCERLVCSQLLVLWLFGAFAAVTLMRWGRRRSSPLWLTLAVVVGVSRAVVRIHHASDVVGGAAPGVALARLLAKPLDRIAGRR